MKNLESILAENMRRFNTKNLTPDSLSKYIHEQTTVPANIYQKNAATTTIAQLPKIMQTYTPQNGTVTITDGNPWLATQRAKALQSFLTTQAQKALNIPVDANSIVITETKVQGTGNANQYTLGKLKAKLRKAPVVQGQYPYSILYNFYDINGVPHILVTKPGKGNPQVNDNPAGSDDWAKQRIKKFADAIPDAFVVKQGGNSSPTANGANWGIMIPINGGYTAKKAGRLYFSDIKQYEAMRNFITSYTDIAGASGQHQETGDLKGRTSLQTDFRSEMGGGGNYIFGRGSGAKAVMINKAGQEAPINIVRMESSKVGVIPGDVAAGNEEKWVEIGSFKLNSTMFPDNLITINPSSYQTIIKLIQDEIAKLAEEGFRPIQLTAEIQGFASTDNANNRCPKGSKPDHTWGGPVTPDKWITLQ
jgi:hypothetical protein